MSGRRFINLKYTPVDPLGTGLTKGGRSIRVGVEATGLYSRPIALALHRHRRAAVMVLNPKAIARPDTSISVADLLP